MDTTHGLMVWYGLWWWYGVLWCGGSESEERARIEDELEIPVIHEALQTTEEGLLN